MARPFWGLFRAGSPRRCQENCGESPFLIRNFVNTWMDSRLLFVKQRLFKLARTICQVPALCILGLEAVVLKPTSLASELSM